MKYSKLIDLLEAGKIYINTNQSKSVYVLILVEAGHRETGMLSLNRSGDRFGKGVVKLVNIFIIVESATPFQIEIRSHFIFFSREKFAVSLLKVFCITSTNGDAMLTF